MHKIAAVFDTSFGQRLLVLANDHHVWIVESEVNKPWIRKSWESDRRDPSEAGVTSFVAFPEETPEIQLLRILDTIADHHGPGMQTPPWQELSVYGAELGLGVRDALIDLGFVRIEPNKDGFCAYRDDE